MGKINQKEKGQVDLTSDLETDVNFCVFHEFICFIITFLLKLC